MFHWIGPGQPYYKVDVNASWPFSNVIGHDVRNAGANESKLDDERVEEGWGRADQVAQHVRPELFANFLGLLGKVEAREEVVALGVGRVRVAENWSLLGNKNLRLVFILSGPIPASFWKYFSL